MLILGCLALLQILFLPGFVILSLLKLQQGIIKTAVLALGLSLTCNYLIVFILTTLHSYTRPSVYCLFIIELLFVLWNFRRVPHQQLANGKFDFSNLNFQKLFIFFKNRSFTTLLTQLLTIIAIFYLIRFYIQKDPNPKTIFSIWDVVVNWNRWAVDWYHNIFPERTYEYPQLFPSNISLTYQFIGNSTVQLFGKMIFYFVPLSMFACLWDLSKQKKQLGYLWASIFLVIFLIYLFGPLAVSGDADVPVATMEMIVLYVLLAIGRVDPQEKVIKYIIIGSFIAAGAAVTKQAGLLLVIIYPVLTYSVILKSRRFDTKYLKLKLFTAHLLITLLVVVPWYLYKIIEIHHNIDQSAAIPLLKGEAYYNYTDPTYYQRFSFAFLLLTTALKSYFIYLLVPVLIIIACFNNYLMRRLFFMLSVPAFLIWAVFFSYDLRNIAFALPPICMILGFGVQHFPLQVRYNLQHRQSNLILLASLLASSIIFLNVTYNSERLIAHQFNLQKQLGFPEVNAKLYDYFSTHTLEGNILSNNPMLKYLPKLDTHFVAGSFFSVTELIKKIGDVHANYLLIMEQHTLNTSLSTLTVDQFLASHTDQFQLIFNDTNSGCVFYKVKTKNA